MPADAPQARDGTARTQPETTDWHQPRSDHSISSLLSCCVAAQTACRRKLGGAAASDMLSA